LAPATSLAFPSAGHHPINPEGAVTQGSAIAEVLKRNSIQQITTNWYRYDFILPLSELTNSYHCPSELQVNTFVLPYIWLRGSAALPKRRRDAEIAPYHQTNGPAKRQFPSLRIDVKTL
jgi:hypothetical protein